MEVNPESDIDIKRAEDRLVEEKAWNIVSSDFIISSEDAERRAKEEIENLKSVNLNAYNTQLQMSHLLIQLDSLTGGKPETRKLIKDYDSEMKHFVNDYRSEHNEKPPFNWVREETIKQLRKDNQDLSDEVFKLLDQRLSLGRKLKMATAELPSA